MQAKANRFRQLHERPEIFVIPNPWDVGTAKAMRSLGFEALATTSAGYAFSVGRCDGDGAVGRDETLRHARRIVEATDLPVSADLENGFGDSPDEVAETIRRAGAVGLCGGSIEDFTFRPESPLYERSAAVERVAAAVEAARALPHRFTLTARAENFIRGRPDLDDTLWRLRAYEDAGADVLYAPGLPNPEAIRLVCTELRKGVNVVAGVNKMGLSLAELQALGVKRVSIGSSFFRAAIKGLLSAATEVRNEGHAHLHRSPPLGRRLQRPTRNLTRRRQNPPACAGRTLDATATKPAPPSRPPNAHTNHAKDPPACGGKLDVTPAKPGSRGTTQAQHQPRQGFPPLAGGSWMSHRRSRAPEAVGG